MPQKLCLHVVSGPQEGQIVGLNNDSTLIVGRLPECGLCIPQDLTVSRTHFQIDVHLPTCQLTHLSETSETFVNGMAVATIELHPDDEIAFGDGNKVRLVFADSLDAHAAPTAPQPIHAELSKSIENRFSIATASCGWSIYESIHEKLDFGRLLSILIDSENVFALIDFGKVGIPVPDRLIQRQYLFPWMQSPALEQYSPIFAFVTGNPAVAGAIRSGWGRGGIVCCGTELKDAELVSHWRTAIGAKGEQPGPSVTAYYLPSILNLMLTSQQFDELEPLLSELTWIFIESPKSPGNWRLFTKADFIPFLTNAGLCPDTNQVTIKS